MEIDYRAMQVIAEVSLGIVGFSAILVPQIILEFNF
jgi:hypothetical protein